MHELSIAQSIVETINSYVAEEQRHAVKTVSLNIGQHSGVVVDSLEFCFNAVIIDTPLCNAKLKINDIPFLLQCASCNTTSASEYGFSVCQKCGSNETRVVAGTELHVAEIELDDFPTVT
mgnify:CR=1